MVAHAPFGPSGKMHCPGPLLTNTNTNFTTTGWPRPCRGATLRTIQADAVFGLTASFGGLQEQRRLEKDRGGTGLEATGFKFDEEGRGARVAGGVWRGRRLAWMLEAPRGGVPSTQRSCRHTKLEIGRRAGLAACDVACGWRSSARGGGARLFEASELNPDAALCAGSWGCMSETGAQCARWAPLRIGVGAAGARRTHGNPELHTKVGTYACMVLCSKLLPALRGAT